MRDFIFSKIIFAFQLATRNEMYKVMRHNVHNAFLRGAFNKILAHQEKFTHLALFHRLISRMFPNV